MYTYTINLHEWSHTMPPPYVIAVISADEQSDLRLTCNIIDCDTDEVRIGSTGRFTFEDEGEVFIPVFELDHV